MIVSMWMSRDIISIEPEQSITMAAMLMKRHHVRRLPVVERSSADGHLVGILTRSNVFAAYPPGQNPFSPTTVDHRDNPVRVSDVMHTHPITTTPESPVESAARLMAENKIGGLPVVRHQHLVGMITESDIFRAFVELLDSSAGEARITFQSLPHEDVLPIVLKAAESTHVRLISVLSTQHQGQPLCVVRVSGTGVDAFVEQLCQGHHPPLNVLRT